VRKGVGRLTDDLQREIYELHAGICQALSDPKRIAILYDLRDGPRNVTELAAGLGVNPVTVSRHLKVLREQRLVETAREGASVYYALADVRVLEALDLLRAVLASSLAQRKALAEAMG
jgi:DNA-binding transcriptional ArsR family regulator